MAVANWKDARGWGLTSSRLTRLERVWYRRLRDDVYSLKKRTMRPPRCMPRTRRKSGDHYDIVPENSSLRTPIAVAARLMSTDSTSAGVTLGRARYYHKQNNSRLRARAQSESCTSCIVTTPRKKQEEKNKIQLIRNEGTKCR